MKEFKTSLVREKFVIHDQNPKTKERKEPFIALSNRLRLDFLDHKGRSVEVLIVRAQNMHTCVRMSARLLQAYKSGGALMTRANKYNWADAWDAVANNYEQSYNPDRWIAIYHNGRTIFSDGKHHPFLDVIEKCDATNDSEYELSIAIAEQAFQKTGKTVHIEYDGNVALAIHLEKDHGRCGIILRGADRTTTFTFTATAHEKMDFNHAQCLTGAAAFLEGIQMAFMVGMNEEKIRLGYIARHTKEEKQTREARARLTQLAHEITNMERGATVRYRPEKPEFNDIVVEAELVAQKIFTKK